MVCATSKKNTFRPLREVFKSILTVMIPFDERILFCTFIHGFLHVPRVAKTRSLYVDKYLGFQCESIEEKVRSQNTDNELLKNQQNWQHLSLQAMQTPYVEIRNILELLKLKPGQHIVDLGCAYARMGFVIHRHYKDILFSGYELEHLRTLETQRVLKKWLCNQIRVYTADLSAENFVLPEADVFFIFDYGNERLQQKTLQDLRKSGRPKAN